MSLPDTNHNIKNARYQYLGGSSPASFGCHVFDPYLIMKVGVPKEVYRVIDYASDALPMRLASFATLTQMINKNYKDVGNCAVPTVSLAFMRLRSYAVNGRNINWKERSIYTWCTFIWKTSFHTQGSTMLTNKRNDLLETVGLVFLLPCSDVSQARRLTLECNEHMYGFFWIILREFNTE